MPSRWYRERAENLSKLHAAVKFPSETVCTNEDTVSVWAHNHSLVFQQIFAESIQVPGTVLCKRTAGEDTEILVLIRCTFW